MTRETDRPIHRMYKKNFESLGLFFWVEAQKKIVPTITMAQSIDSYYRFIDEPYDYNSAVVIISRMRSDCIDLNYDKKVTSKTGCPKFSRDVTVA